MVELVALAVVRCFYGALGRALASLLEVNIISKARRKGKTSKKPGGKGTNLSSLLPGIPIQTLTQPIQHPLTLTNIRQHGTILSNPIPLNQALLLFLLLHHLRLILTEPDESRELNPFLIAVSLRVLGPQLVRYALDRYC